MLHRIHFYTAIDNRCHSSACLQRNLKIPSQLQHSWKNCTITWKREQKKKFIAKRFISQLRGWQELVKKQGSVHLPVLGFNSVHRLKVVLTTAAWDWDELTDEAAAAAGEWRGISACCVVFSCTSWRMGTTITCSSPVGDDGIGLLSWIYKKHRRRTVTWGRRV